MPELADLYFPVADSTADPSRARPLADACRHADGPAVVNPAAMATPGCTRLWWRLTLVSLLTNWSFSYWRRAGGFSGAGWRVRVDARRDGGN